MNEHFFRFPLNTLELEFLHKRFLVSIFLHSIWNRRRLVECLCSFPRLPIKVVDTCFEIVDLRPLIVLPTLHLQKQMPNCSHEPVNIRIVSKLETFTYLLGYIIRLHVWRLVYQKQLTEIPFCVGVGVLVLLAEALGVFVLLFPGVTGGVACLEVLL